MKNFLSEAYRAELQTRLKKEKHGPIAERIKILLLADRGESYVSIAKIYFINSDTVGNYVSEYINDNKKSTGTRSKLSAEQTAELDAHLTEHTYLTTQEICAHVQETCPGSYQMRKKVWAKRASCSKVLQ
ncbi:MAG: hypothetical protein LBF84_00390 [Holosporales bacterium]|jgi:transposase|nr:hypothetical protein [Holosporales bacterium]